MKSNKPKLSRISISLPEDLLEQFDSLVCERQYKSRSQAIAEVLQQSLVDHQESEGNAIMAGTINLVFDDSVPQLRHQLATVQRNYLDEVISSLNVNLESNKTMAVILVQGPCDKLKMIANEMISHKGVMIGKLLLSAAIIPQVHPLPNTD